MGGMKAHKGIAMEGLVASWYARIAERDRRRYEDLARRVKDAVPIGSRILELAPGPGHLAIELAKSGGYLVTGLDISHSFVRIARSNARKAGVIVAFEQGNAAHMPFATAAFDFVVCMAAFKNLAEPVRALDEIHRVLKPDGRALIQDLRSDASVAEVDRQVREMRISRPNRLVTQWIFRHVLLKSAYSPETLRRVVAESRFGTGRLEMDGVGFGLWLVKRG